MEPVIGKLKNAARERNKIIAIDRHETKLSGNTCHSDGNHER